MNGSPAAMNDMIGGMANIETSNKVIICAPYPFICCHDHQNTRFEIGAQDCSAHESGAYTGEVSAKILSDFGTKYVIVGHSERREYHNEDNNVVREKAAAALAHGLTPIICVGETMAEKEAGKTMDIIESGVRESIPSDVKGDIIVAYEPRWAIGAGLTPTSDEIMTAHKLIADTLESLGLAGTPVLYGASVNGANAKEIMSIPNVDGVLVGGASLKPDSFIPIITSME